MSSGGRGGHRGGGGKDGGGASGGDRQSSNRGRSRSSRSGRNHRGPKQSTITTSGSGAGGTASLPPAENSLPSPPPPSAASTPMAAERRDDGLVPGAGLLALQALAAAQKKNTGEGKTLGSVIPAAVAEAAEKAVAGGSTEGPKGRGRGGKSRGKTRGGGGGNDGSGGSGGGRAGGSGGGGSSSRDMGSIKGRDNASQGARGGGAAAAMAAAAISAAAKTSSSSRSRGGKGGAGDATGRSTKSGNGVKKDFTEDPGKRHLSEVSLYPCLKQRGGGKPYCYVLHRLYFCGTQLRIIFCAVYWGSFSRYSKRFQNIVFVSFLGLGRYRTWNAVTPVAMLQEPNVLFDLRCSACAFCFPSG